ncbi:MAG TPA: hypothetical protein VFD38_07335 [Myxococcaceae bacterium]|nr:hypothetical protein [Myxococcaceae bacterium]
MERPARRVLGFRFLCAFPFITFVSVASRPLHIAGVREAVGVVLFAAVVAAAWSLAGRALVSGPDTARGRAVAGLLLIAPWAAIALLWVGIGAPFQATPTENRMRFVVLLSGSIVVSAAFVALKFALDEAGERLYSTLGLAASIPAGTGYFSGMSIIVASYVARLRDGRTPQGFDALDDLFSVVEFFGCILTYLTTAAFSESLARARWMGRGAARGYQVACLLLIVLLVLRGISYPVLSESTLPWYARPGLFAGIPAIPWIMPALLGAVVLRRAEAERA